MQTNKPYKAGVLFAHGIQGRPEQFSFLTEALPEGVLCRNILLPGHGQTVREFRRSGMKDWREAVNAHAREMNRLCERVFFVGHSMGCLLGLLASREEGVSVDGMLLLCCPLRVRLTARYFRGNVLAYTKKENTDDPFVRAAFEANGVAAKHAVGYMTCIKPYIELFRLIHKVNSEKPLPGCPVTLLFSGLDEIVSPKSAEKARFLPDADVGFMPGCGHNYFTFEQKERVKALMLGMLSEAKE